MVDQGATPAAMGHVDHAEQQIGAGFGGKVGGGFYRVSGVISAVDRAQDGLGHGESPYLGWRVQYPQLAQKTGRAP
jgi:hypothetical protein